MGNVKNLTASSDILVQGAKALTQQTDVRQQPPASPSLGLPTRGLPTRDLPTPVDAIKLGRILQGYSPKITAFLLKGFLKGFSLGYSGPRQFHISRNHQSFTSNPHQARLKIEQELLSARVAGPFEYPPFHTFHSSPLGLVPKKDPGQFRVIHDLSFPKGNSINSNIPHYYSSVQYLPFHNFLDLVRKFGRGCLISKTDIESAFRIIPIAPADYDLLGFTLDGKYYYDRCLPMGCSSSCQLFERLSTALQWVMINKYGAFGMWHLLDDFVFVGPPRSPKCQSDLEQFLSLAKFIGIPIKNEKTFLPSTTSTVCGIEIDTEQMVTRLPQDKVTKINQLLAEYAVRRKVTLKELQSLIGILNFACLVITPGRTFLRRLQDLTKGIQASHHRIRLTIEARKDIRAWITFMEGFNGKSVLLQDRWMSSDSLKLFSDSASTRGYAAVFGSQWFSGEWPALWQQYHITVLELFPIVAAIEYWGHQLRDKCILLLCDNKAVVDIINSQTSKDITVMILVRRLVVTSLKFNILFKSKHIPGKHNVIPDLLSRFQTETALQKAPWLNKLPTQLPEYILPWTL